MFANDTRFRLKSRIQGIVTCYNKDLNTLMEWLKEWLLAFNMDKCNVMHIGHDLPMVYTMSDGNNTIQLETIAVKKDLGVYITNDLKPTNSAFRLQGRPSQYWE